MVHPHNCEIILFLHKGVMMYHGKLLWVECIYGCEKSSLSQFVPNSGFDIMDNLDGPVSCTLLYTVQWWCHSSANLKFGKQWINFFNDYVTVTPKTLYTEFKNVRVFFRIIV